MPATIRPTLLAGCVTAAMIASPLALSHFDDKQPKQSYRQSVLTVWAMNFGPIAAMVKGEMPWDDELLKGFAGDLEAATQLNLIRGFAPGSEKGTTRAKPEIWENTEDFAAKLEDLRSAASELNAVAQSGDKKAIAEATKTTGGACKACHDEYKAKDYLY
jgi:cytochrome c556